MPDAETMLEEALDSINPETLTEPQKLRLLALFWRGIEAVDNERMNNG